MAPLALTGHRIRVAGIPASQHWWQSPMRKFLGRLGFQQQAALARNAHQVAMRACAQLFHQVRAMPIQRLVADAEIRRDRLRRPVGQQAAQGVALARGQDHVAQE